MNIITAGTRKITIPNFGPVVPARPRGGAAAGSTLLDDLVAYWNMNEVAGARADSVGDLTLGEINTIGSNTGISGNAAVFVSANGTRLENVVANILDISAGISFEMNLWIYLDVVFNSNIIIIGSLSQWDIWLYLHNGKPSMRVDGLSVHIEGPAGLTALTTATWYNISIYYDQPAGEIGIRVNDDDGEHVTTAVTGTPDDNGSVVSMAGPGNFGRGLLDGRIDEVGFWKGRILTPAERTELHNGGMGLSYPF